MFTGLVQHLGRVVGVQPTSAGAALVVDAAGWDHRPLAGDSIAVNGCCLTVAENPSDGGLLRFDVVPQTLRLTNLGDLSPHGGQGVNLEHAVTPSTLLGGHIVQGHIDGVGRVMTIEPGNEHRLRISIDRALAPFAVLRGSVAVDGVSLTIAAVGESWFEVALVPTTLARTTLGSLTVGSRVNIETDYIAKSVARWLQMRGEA
jgi:riboflavin synthase